MRKKKEVSWQQRQADAKMRAWRWSFIMDAFRPRAMFIPLSILNRIYNIPHTDASFEYRDVCVFGIRIIRYQIS